MPIIIILGLLIVAVSPILWVIVGLQIVRRAGEYSITKPAREMLFTIVDRESRFKAKVSSTWSFIEQETFFGPGHSQG